MEKKKVPLSHRENRAGYEDGILTPGGRWFSVYVLCLYTRGTPRGVRSQVLLYFGKGIYWMYTRYERVVSFASEWPIFQTGFGEEPLRVTFTLPSILNAAYSFRLTGGYSDLGSRYSAIMAFALLN